MYHNLNFIVTDQIFKQWHTVCLSCKRRNVKSSYIIKISQSLKAKLELIKMQNLFIL